MWVRKGRWMRSERGKVDVGERGDGYGKKGIATWARRRGRRVRGE